MTRLFIVDAFADAPFRGNPAGVCLLDAPAPEAWMRSLAAELGFAETAFLHRKGDAYALRWFTPAKEVPLCGHATLASAHVLWAEGIEKEETLAFDTLSGRLTTRRGDGLVWMDFPVRPHASAPTPATLEKALGQRVVEHHLTSEDHLVVLRDEAAVRAVDPDLAALAKLDPRAVIITAEGETSDYVHRYFAPSWGIPEDPATGSIQCALGPYWQARLGKDDLDARQLSTRGASMRVRPRGERVLIGGRAVTMVRGSLGLSP